MEPVPIMFQDHGKRDACQGHEVSSSPPIVPKIRLFVTAVWIGASSSANGGHLGISSALPRGKSVFCRAPRLRTNGVSCDRPLIGDIFALRLGLFGFFLQKRDDVGTHLIFGDADERHFVAGQKGGRFADILI